MFLSFEFLASALQLYVIRAFKVMTTGKGFDFSVKKVWKLFARPCTLSKPHDKGGDEYGKAAWCLSTWAGTRSLLTIYMQKVSFTRLTAGRVSIRGKPRKFIPEIGHDGHEGIVKRENVLHKMWSLVDIGMKLCETCSVCQVSRVSKWRSPVAESLPERMEQLAVNLSYDTRTCVNFHVIINFQNFFSNQPDKSMTYSTLSNLCVWLANWFLRFLTPSSRRE